MSDYQQKEGTGTIFANRFKNGEKSPDWSGEILINGQKMSVGLWNKKSNKDNSNFFSISITAKRPYQPGQDQRRPYNNQDNNRQQNNQRQTPPQQNSNSINNPNDDFPF